MSDAALARALRPARPVRRRNSLLQAMEHLRARFGLVRLRSVMLFLYVCENQGATVSELAYASRLTVALTARLMRTLAAPDAPQAAAPALGLIRFESNARDLRLKFVFLTPLGLGLRAELERIIAEASQIAPPIATKTG